MLITKAKLWTGREFNPTDREKELFGKALDIIEYLESNNCVFYTHGCFDAGTDGRGDVWNKDIYELNIKGYNRSDDKWARIRFSVRTLPYMEVTYGSSKETKTKKFNIEEENIFDIVKFIHRRYNKDWSYRGWFRKKFLNGKNEE